MGQDLSQDTFTRADHDAFCSRLEKQIDELAHFMGAPEFSQGPASIGAEAELYIVDKRGRPYPANEQLLSALHHPLLTEELNQFNLEVNLSPVLANGAPFTTMRDELLGILSALRTEAARRELGIVTTGILPTLKREHIHKTYMTDRARYRALTNGLKASRGDAFAVNISGDEPLKMLSDEVTLEGANTSFQVHLKVPASEFANSYNAAQLTSPLVLAISGNSPTFLSHKLWQETRIALFKQSIDDRHPATANWRRPSRVSFGHGWVRETAWELFAESVALYEPLIPNVDEQNRPFAELCLHHGTVWSWNRAVFEHKNGGHLRIEFRALPSGPTVTDMMANAALQIGLTHYFAGKISAILPAMPFNYAEYNFYRAAKDGLSANLLWPRKGQHSVAEMPVKSILAMLLPRAADGLAALGVDAAEIDYYMSLIEQRLSTGQTGATWQLKEIEKHDLRGSRDRSLDAMLNDYMVLSESDTPVSQWG